MQKQNISGGIFGTQNENPSVDNTKGFQQWKYHLKFGLVDIFI